MAGHEIREDHEDMFWSLRGLPWIVLCIPTPRASELSPMGRLIEAFGQVFPSIFKDQERPSIGAFESIVEGLAAILSTLVTARMSE